MLASVETSGQEGCEKRRSSDPDKQTDRWTCSLGVCLYVLVMQEVDNLAQD